MRHEEPDPDDPDGSFEVHLQPLMEGVLVIELDKVAELLQRYRENQGRKNYPYRPEKNESLEYTQYELTAAVNTRNAPMQNPQQMQDIICEHWTWRYPLMELKIYYVPFEKEIWNEYSIHSERELDLSFRLEPLYPKADRIERKIRTYPKSN